MEEIYGEPSEATILRLCRVQLCRISLRMRQDHEQLEALRKHHLGESRLEDCSILGRVGGVKEARMGLKVREIRSQGR